MSKKRAESYRAPAITEYGSVEAVTETFDKNKDTLGEDTDIQSIPIASGSFGR